MSFRWTLSQVILPVRNFCSGRLMWCLPPSYFANLVGVRFLVWLGLNRDISGLSLLLPFSTMGCCLAWWHAQPSAGGVPLASSRILPEQGFSPSFRNGASLSSFCVSSGWAAAVACDHFSRITGRKHSWWCASSVLLPRHLSGAVQRHYRMGRKKQIKPF